jgi:hypothetical protein
MAEQERLRDSDIPPAILVRRFTSLEGSLIGCKLDSPSVGHGHGDSRRWLSNTPGGPWRPGSESTADRHGHRLGPAVARAVTIAAGSRLTER